ncbi:MAG TPA: glycosyltransferase family 4 protein [Promineifilum sp.]|nr:glycosyltransferase family 4 protein [Promineifilum sp.]
MRRGHRSHIIVNGHVVLVTPAYPPFPGGGERYVGAVARGLVAAGWRVTVLTSSAATEADFWQGAPATSDKDEDGVRVIRRPVRPTPGGRTGLLLWRKGMVLLSSLPTDPAGALMRMARRVPAIDGLDETLAGLDADVLHAFNGSWECGLVAAYARALATATTASPTATAASPTATAASPTATAASPTATAASPTATAASPTPLVVTPFAHLGEHGNDRVARNSTMSHQLRIMRSADRLLTLTTVEADGLARYHVPAERLGVIGSAADPPPADFRASPYYATDHCEARGTFGVYIGRLSYDKGALHAADAIRTLRQRGRDVALLLIGSSTPEFERYRRGLSPHDRAAIRTLGVLSDRDKHAVLSRAKFLMLPSRSDSFGIVILEAWSHSVPVIAARAGGIPGVVDDGATGLLVPFADVEGLVAAAERLISDEPFAQRLGWQGYERLRSGYNWATVVKRVAGHYEQVIAAHHQR